MPPPIIPIPHPAPPPPGVRTQPLALAVLCGITASHLLNDLMQAVLVAVYPLMKTAFHLSFAEIGRITLVNQVTASLLQPLVGLIGDRRPRWYALSLGMAFTFCGLLLLAAAPGYLALLAAAALVGIGSSVFHPEASRIARLAAGGRYGLAQSVFQVGGNLGTPLGTLLVATLVLPRGQSVIAWFAPAALAAMALLWWIGRWYQRQHLAAARPAAAAQAAPGAAGVTGTRVGWALAVLTLLVFSKYVYLASLVNYYAFYLMARFHLGAEAAQLQLAVFLFAVAAGTLIGGSIGDRIGRKRVIWCSILGVAPFTIALPYADLATTEALAVAIGLILASAFSAILVFAQELVPGRVGLVSGLFFGAAFGIAGIAAAALGQLADRIGIEAVFALCSYLPLLGLCTAFLPDLRPSRPA